VKLDPGSGLTERFVTARGRRMRTVQAGSGTPLVVFESGLAAAASVWSDVQRRVSAHTATLSYDRAGIGGSKRARDGRRFADLNADLEAVLDALGHDGPVLLVGQSWGGPIIRAFSHFTTRPVAGLVIVDGTRSQVLTSKEGKALRVYFGLLGKLSRLGLHRRFRAKLLVGITGGLSDEDGARVLRDMLRGNAARAGAAECKGLAEEADELGALEALGDSRRRAGDISRGRARRAGHRGDARPVSRGTAKRGGEAEAAIRPRHGESPRHPHAPAGCRRCRDRGANAWRSPCGLLHLSPI
jgi:pimeloyl-ACP methyl ester carboxylesterase